MDKWYLYRDCHQRYVAVAWWVAGWIPMPGTPCFGGWPVSSEVVNSCLQEAGGRVIR